MNSISAPNRFNSIPYGSESQDTATRGQHSRKLTAMKVGAAALCGAALATQMIASLRQGNSPTSDFGPMRMLAANGTEPFLNQTNTLLNETDPCAELNTGDEHYVPFDREYYKKTGLVAPVVCGLAATISFLQGIVDCFIDDSDDSCRAGVGSACCAAVNGIFFGFTLAAYLQLMGMQDGECWIEPRITEGSRG